MLTSLLLLPTAVTALWPSAGRSSPTRGAHSPELLPLDALQCAHAAGDAVHGLNPRDVDLSTAERSRIFSLGEGKAVGTGLPRTDCFRSAAARLDCDHLEIDEATRVQAAIVFTLCELSTARTHATPLECRPFTKAGTSVSQQDQYACVEAVARSPQHWASYSGYLQRVSLHCLAFRAGSDIDTAKAIYANATHEKVALIQHLQKRERGMESSVSHLRDLLATFDKLSNTLRAQVARAEESAISARAASENMVQDAGIAVYDLVRRFEEALLAVNRVSQDKGLARIAEDVSGHIVYSLEDLQTWKQHAIRLSGIILTMESDLQAGVEQLLSGLVTERQTIEASVDHISSRSTELGAIVEDALSAVGSLIPISARLSDNLATHLAAVQLSELHVQSTKAQLDQLAHSITDLVDSTAAQMRMINDTAATVRDDLRAAALYRRHDLELWDSLIERLVQWILTSPYGTHVGSAFSSAYVQMVWLVLRGAWSLLCSSATVLFYSLILSDKKFTLFGHVQMQAILILLAAVFNNATSQVPAAPVTPQRRRSRIYSVALRNDVNYGWDEGDERAKTPTRPRPRTRILSIAAPQS